jgi:hypothetical protein
LMKAKLSVAPIKENPEPILFADSGDESDEAGAGNETDFYDESRFYGKWRRKAEVVVERNLLCTAASDSFGKKL